MKDIAIFGSGGLGRETAASLNELVYDNLEGWNLIGFFDDTKPKGTKISHYGEVLGGIKELNEWPAELDLAICVGYPKGRYKIANEITNPLILFPNLIHSSFYIGDKETFQIGKGNIIQWDCRVTTDTIIGNFNLLNGEVKFGHDQSIGDYNVFMNGTRVSGGGSIGDRNLFGTQSYVMEKLHVGSDITIGPLSALITKPKNGETYIGNPAKRFKY